VLCQGVQSGSVLGVPIHWRVERVASQLLACSSFVVSAAVAAATWPRLRGHLTKSRVRVTLEVPWAAASPTIGDPGYPEDGDPGEARTVQSKLKGGLRMRSLALEVVAAKMTLQSFVSRAERT
jgi:hypothetical protein